MSLLIIALSILLLFSPTAKFGLATTAKLANIQFSQINGYGFFVASDRLSTNYYKAIYTSRETGDLLDVGDRWVQQREVDFWKIGYLAYKKNDIGLGLGINQMDNNQLGWQVYIEKDFDNIIFARLGFERIYSQQPFSIISVGFNINLIEITR